MVAESNENQETAGVICEMKNASSEYVEPQTAGILNIDDILEHQVGACGLWQWLVVSLCMLSAPSMSILAVFVNAVPDTRCRMESNVEKLFSQYGLTFNQASDIIQPKELRISKSQYGCFRRQIDWNNNSVVNDLITNYLISNGTLSENASSQPVETCPLGYVYQSQQFQYPSTIVEEFDLVCKLSWIPPFGTFLFMIGMFMGYIIGGWFGDKYGRKPTAIGFSFVELFGAVLISTASNQYIYHIGRMLVGMTNTGKGSVLRLLPFELTLAKYRAYFSSFLILGLVFFHQSIMVCVAYLVPSWRWLNAICMMPGIISVTFFWLLPESPRWYNAQGQTEKAIKVLERGMYINRLCSRSQNRPEHIRIRPNIEIISKAKAKRTSEPHVSNRLVRVRLRDWCQSFKQCMPNPELWKNLIVGMFLYLTQSLSYFGILLYARVIHNYVYLVVFVNSVMSTPGPLIASVLYRVFRYRRNPLIVCQLITAISLLIGGLYSLIVKPQSDLVLNVSCNCALVLFSTTMIMLSVYVAELFPSNIRTRAVGLSSAVGRLGSSLSTFVNQLDVFVGHGAPILVFTGASLFHVLLLMSLRDTTGENLPDVDTVKEKKNENQTDQSVGENEEIVRV